MSANASASASSSNDNSSSAAGKCPVDHETRSLWGLLGKKREGSAMTSTLTNSTTSVPELSPVASTQTQTQTLPASVEEAAKHAQTPLPGQRLPLSTHRAESSIPRISNNNSSSNKTTASSLPSHQVQWNQHGDIAVAAGNANKSETATAPTWVYPSEQQVFNAMKRKGWQGIEEESIPSFLQIHNSVNERSWRQVLEWETGNGNGNGSSVELSRFEGRPTDLTPKAWLLSTLGICDKPFDRHDWYVVNHGAGASSGHGDDAAAAADAAVAAATPPEEKRYVLDFYMHEPSGRNNDGSFLPRVEIDVRPALDTPGAVVQRGIRLLREVFPGMAREWDERKHSRSTSN
eukprot:CAMPEP_0172385858 /NCGR_PEP_ID=MMETSP1061-20121228/3466_1 /TAXON_ID=37318 /ORGANISM="Pseudo-nitzschia pungens, Strain cf. pungens" /LENGTH=346 /DNA_ID=CAMNT_0013115023 /DNA_START=85 /DNA_END=1125 /DNA_ORIENTATION=+